ncbi:hypothetical protein E4T39_07023 [Aureobasidium subglaciale]|nr:hypothetical protein E4T39_07023 [Aureobasidium subglaciale]
MSLAGLPNGFYEWTNGDRIVKTATHLALEENGRIAGGSATFLDCVKNFMNRARVSVPEAVRAITLVPAKMLNLEKTQGNLETGSDAGLLVLSEHCDEKGWRSLFGNLAN